MTKRLCLLPLLLAASAAPAAEGAAPEASGPAADAWLSDYESALEHLGAGEFAAAGRLLASAGERTPEPRLAAADGRFDYLPHLNLAAARYELGEHAAAREALERSAAYGVATRSYVGRQVWDRYALRIMSAGGALASGDEAGNGSFRDFERRAVVLPEPQAEELRNQVLRRCALTGTGPTDHLPWYFHYEYGLELLEAGDPQRAVDELILAANKREESKRGKRMYGMWFTNYLPYYQIAMAHSQLGNWRCAMDAMRLSARYGEFSPSDRGFQDYSDLQKLILRQTDAQG